MKRGLLCVWMFLMCAFGPALAPAGVSVYPTEVFVNPPNRSAPLVLTNPSDGEVEVWLTFSYGYPVSFDTTGVMFGTVYGEGPEEPSAVQWIRAIPERFVLQAQETQTVRVFATPPAGLAPGEYWARITISSRPRKPVAVGSPRTATQLRMDLITQTVVPFHFRHGVTSTGVTIREHSTATSGNSLIFDLQLERSGNASFWGRIHARLVDVRGRVVKEKEFRLVVYRRLRYQGRMDIGDVSPGTYTLELRMDNIHPNIAPRLRLRSDPIAENVVINIP